MIHVLLAGIAIGITLTMLANLALRALGRWLETVPTEEHP